MRLIDQPGITLVKCAVLRGLPQTYVHMNGNKRVERLLEHVLRQAELQHIARIVRVRLAVGALSGLSAEIIVPAWRVFSKGTLAEAAILDIRVIHAEAQCMVCFRRYQPEGEVIHCPFCGSVGAKILSGYDTVVESLDAV